MATLEPISSIEELDSPAASTSQQSSETPTQKDGSKDLLKQAHSLAASKTADQIQEHIRKAKLKLSKPQLDEVLEHLVHILQRVKPINLILLAEKILIGPASARMMGLLGFIELYGLLWAPTSEILEFLTASLAMMFTSKEVTTPLLSFFSSIKPATDKEALIAKAEQLTEGSKFFQSHVEAWFPGISTLPAWITTAIGAACTLAIVITGGSFLKDTGFKAKNTMIDYISRIKTLASTITSVTGATKSLRQIVEWFMEDVLGFDLTPPEEGKRLEHVQEYMKVLNELEAQVNLLPTNLRLYFEDPGFYQKLMEKATNIDNIYGSYISKPLHIKGDLVRRFNTAREKLTAQITKISSTVGTTVVPATLYVFGDTGVGKSLLREYILEQISKMEGKPIDSYVRSASDHWDAYTNQPAVVFDDFGKDKTCADHTEMASLYTNAKFIVKMADISEKGRVCDPDYVICCSNMVDFAKSETLLDPSILQRRRDILIHVEDPNVGAADKDHHKPDFTNLKITKLDPWHNNLKSSTGRKILPGPDKFGHSVICETDPDTIAKELFATRNEHQRDHIRNINKHASMATAMTGSDLDKKLGQYHFDEVTAYKKPLMVTLVRGGLKDSLVKCIWDIRSAVLTRQETIADVKKMIFDHIDNMEKIGGGETPITRAFRDAITGASHVPSDMVKGFVDPLAKLLTANVHIHHTQTNTWTYQTVDPALKHVFIKYDDCFMPMYIPSAIAKSDSKHTRTTIHCLIGDTGTGKTTMVEDAGYTILASHQYDEYKECEKWCLDDITVDQQSFDRARKIIMENNQNPHGQGCCTANNNFNAMLEKSEGDPLAFTGRLDIYTFEWAYISASARWITGKRFTKETSDPTKLTSQTVISHVTKAGKTQIQTQELLARIKVVKTADYETLLYDTLKTMAKVDGIERAVYLGFHPTELKGKKWTHMKNISTTGFDMKDRIKALALFSRAFEALAENQDSKDWDLAALEINNMMLEADFLPTYIHYKGTEGFDPGTFMAASIPHPRDASKPDVFYISQVGLGHYEKEEDGTVVHVSNHGRRSLQAGEQKILTIVKDIVNIRDAQNFGKEPKVLKRDIDPKSELPADKIVMILDIIETLFNAFRVLGALTTVTWYLADMKHDWPNTDTTSHELHPKGRELDDSWANIMEAEGPPEHVFTPDSTPQRVPTSTSTGTSGRFAPLARSEAESFQRPARLEISDAGGIQSLSSMGTQVQTVNSDMGRPRINPQPPKHVHTGPMFQFHPTAGPSDYPMFSRPDWDYMQQFIKTVQNAMEKYNLPPTTKNSIDKISEFYLIYGKDPREVAFWSLETYYNLAREVVEKCLPPIPDQSSLEADIMYELIQTFGDISCKRYTAEWTQQPQQALVTKARQDMSALQIAMKASASNTVIIGEPEDPICHGLMLRGRVGITVAHSDIEETTKVVWKGRVYKPTNIMKIANKDLTLFTLPTDAPMAKDLTPYLQPPGTRVDTLQHSAGFYVKPFGKSSYGFFPVSIQAWEERIEYITTEGDKVSTEGFRFKVLTREAGIEDLFTQHGNCGSPIYILDPARKHKILGILVAGNSEHSAMAYITQNTVEVYEHEMCLTPKSDVRLLEHQMMLAPEGFRPPPL